jgi:RNA polymerase sigma factor (sigma-70 family)
MDAVLRAFQEPVQRYLMRRLAQCPDGHDVAGDLRQEVLLRAAGALSRCHFENEQRAVAWVLRIARHVLVDYVRAEHTRHRLVSPETLELLAERAALAQWQSGHHVRDASDLLDDVAGRAMAGLPRQTVELFRLRVQMGLTWPQVGVALGTTANGAKRRFQRAQVALRARFLAVFDALPHAERDALLRSLGLRP